MQYVCLEVVTLLKHAVQHLPVSTVLRRLVIVSGQLSELLLQLVVLELVALDGMKQCAEHADVLAEVLLGVKDITAEPEVTQLIVHAGRSVKH